MTTTTMTITAPVDALRTSVTGKAPFGAHSHPLAPFLGRWQRFVTMCAADGSDAPSSFAGSAPADWTHGITPISAPIEPVARRFGTLTGRRCDERCRTGAVAGR